MATAVCNLKSKRRAVKQPSDPKHGLMEQEHGDDLSDSGLTETDPTDVVSELVARGRTLEEKEDFEDALVVFDEAILPHLPFRSKSDLFTQPARTFSPRMNRS